MNHLKILTILLFVSCGVQKKTIDSSTLSVYQIKNGGPGKGDPGKCYSKMKSIDGDVDWYEIICPNGKGEYELASEYLKQLGYQLNEKNSFKTSNGNALIEFQKKNKLSYGALDEATLYLLIQKSKGNE